MLRWFYKEIKEDWWNVKSHSKEAASFFYYGYIKHDDFSKKNFFHHVRMVWRSFLLPFRQIRVGFQNLSKWWVVIWEDRQFDHSYFYSVLRHKLFLMERFFYSSDTHIENAEKYAEQIKECREILDDLINDISYDKILNEYYTIYPYEDIDFFNFTPSESEAERVTQGLPPRYATLNYKKLPPEEEKKRSLLFKSYCDKAESKKNELRKQLFENLEKNVEYWWD